jgi:protein-tyrosine-phosphatase
MISRDGGRQVEIVSAGLIGPGRMVPEESLAVAGPLAAALRRHESRLLTPAMLRCGDLAIVMAPGMSGDVAKALGYSPPTLILGDLDPSPWHGRAIADPWGHPAKEFTRAFARIDRCLEALAAEWQRR